ncbi:MAG: hypothetical protein ACFFAO_09440 [Candidatus Hermodarchaeota archaeon]
MANISPVDVKQISFEPDIQFTYRRIKKKVLNHLFRTYSLINCQHIISELTESEYFKLSETTKFPELIVYNIIKCFLKDLFLWNRFLSECKIKHNPENHLKKVKVYLYKIHRLAPVFNYKRAKKNLESLHILCSNTNFWPQITTQLAVVIYITDKLDKNIPKNKNLMQKNIRTLCNCSAYAFHRTRKKLKIDEIIKK